MASIPDDGHALGAFEQVKAGWERWEALPAARNHRILLVELMLNNVPVVLHP